MTDSIESIAGGIFIWTLRSAAIGLAVLALLGAFRRASASVRHLILVSGIALIVTMPLFDLALRWMSPESEISWILPPPLPLTVLNEVTMTGVGSASAFAATENVAVAEGMPVLTIQNLFRMGLGAFVILAAAGFLFLGLRILIAQFRLSQLAKVCRPAEGRIRALADSIQETPNCRILIGPAGKAVPPMTWGTFPASVLLPNEAETWTDEVLLDVLRHELAHVRRRDAFTLCFAQWLQAIQWWNPVVWMMVRKLQVECEHACDDLVVDSCTEGDRNRYAHLVLSLSSSHGSSPAHLGMANVGNLETRLTRIASGTTNHRTISRWMLGLVLSTTMLTPIALAWSKTDKVITEERVFEGMAFDTVVLDAGHGGHDGGATFGDVREAELNLKLTKLVQQLLENEGFKVVLTREDDVLVPFSTRSATVRKQKEAILVSLHFNSSPDKAVRGIEVYRPNREGLNQTMLAALMTNELSQLEEMPFRSLRPAMFTLLKNSRKSHLRGFRAG
ncbi:MAG: N-acetylmuramoyl-L-alanine amidase [Verrucomicrobiales bacterium]|jgi:N-acetylmuramoyl-L-alanine amidase